MPAAYAAAGAAIGLADTPRILNRTKNKKRALSGAS